ncbi:hypothetical protein M1466_03165 [Candidatus Dependentiae bacterium]|nr:hypothetical protein [Candidatus Dependentiae bacterium]
MRFFALLIAVFCCILPSGLFCCQTDMAALGKQLMTEKKICLGTVHPLQFKGAFMQQLQGFINNLCIVDIAIKPQIGTKQLHIIGKVQESGLPAQLPISLVLGGGS